MEDSVFFQNGDTLKLDYTVSYPTRYKHDWWLIDCSNTNRVTAQD